MELEEDITAVSLQFQRREFILHDSEALQENILLAETPVALMYIPDLSQEVEECTMKGEAIERDETIGIGLTSTLRIRRKTIGNSRIISSVARQLRGLADQPAIANELGFTVTETPEAQTLRIADNRTNIAHLATFSPRYHTIVVSNYGTSAQGEETLTILPPDSTEFDMAESLEAQCRLLNFVTDSITSFQETIPGQRVNLEIGKALPLNPQTKTIGAKKEIDIHSAEPRQSALDTIGGLFGAKEKLRELANIYNDPELLQQCVADMPRGILLYGPAGTGKTELAKAFVTEIGAKLVEVNNDTFDSKWTSEGAQNLRDLFDEAKEASDLVVLFFDELDSTIPNNNQNSHDNQLNGVFKQEMADIAQHYPHILVVATTNRDLQAFDKALIRSGRFDLHVPILEPSQEERIDIFGTLMYAMAGKDMPYMFGTDINLPELAELTDTMTGNDINGILRGLRFKRRLHMIRTKTEEPISQQDFVTAIHEYRRQL